MSLRSACGAGLLALAGAGLSGAAGCGVVVDEPQIDTRAEQRPGTWVRRLETEISKLRGAYDDMVVRATPAQRRRLPSIESRLPPAMVRGWVGTAVGPRPESRQTMTSGPCRTGHRQPRALDRRRWV